MLIFWRPDLKQYKATVLEEVPANTPVDPQPINATLTPNGAVFHPQPDSFSATAGQLIASVHSDKDNSGLFCRAFGSYMMEGTAFGWIYAYKQGADGAITAYTTDKGVGIINDMQVSWRSTESAAIITMPT
jgi:hypothetical protein